MRKQTLLGTALQFASIFQNPQVFLPHTPRSPKDKRYPTGNRNKMLPPDLQREIRGKAALKRKRRGEKLQADYNKCLANNPCLA